MIVDGRTAEIARKDLAVRESIGEEAFLAEDAVQTKV